MIFFLIIELIVHSASPTRTILSTTLLILGILLIAANLRAPITGIGPVLDQMIDSYQLTASKLEC